MILTLGTTPAGQRTMTFEQLVVDGVNRAAEVRETASGKSINVARVLKTLGHDVIATGFLGGDGGKAVREDLARAGIGDEFVMVGAKTRTCVTVIDSAAGTATELIEESHPVEPPDADALLGKLDELLEAADVLVLSGTL